MVRATNSTPVCESQEHAKQVTVRSVQSGAIVAAASPPLPMRLVAQLAAQEVALLPALLHPAGFTQGRRILTNPFISVLVKGHAAPKVGAIPTALQGGGLR